MNFYVKLMMLAINEIKTEELSPPADSSFLENITNEDRIDDCLKTELFQKVCYSFFACF